MAELNWKAWATEMKLDDKDLELFFLEVFSHDACVFNEMPEEVSMPSYMKQYTPRALVRKFLHHYSFQSELMGDDALHQWASLAQWLKWDEEMEPLHRKLLVIVEMDVLFGVERARVPLLAHMTKEAKKVMQAKGLQQKGVLFDVNAVEELRSDDTIINLQCLVTSLGTESLLARLTRHPRVQLVVVGQCLQEDVVFEMMELQKDLIVCIGKEYFSQEHRSYHWDKVLKEANRQRRKSGDRVQYSKVDTIFFTWNRQTIGGLQERAMKVHRFSKEEEEKVPSNSMRRAPAFTFADDITFIAEHLVVDTMIMALHSRTGVTTKTQIHGLQFSFSSITIERWFPSSEFVNMAQPSVFGGLVEHRHHLDRLFRPLEVVEFEHTRKDQLKYITALHRHIR